MVRAALASALGPAGSALAVIDITADTPHELESAAARFLKQSIPQPGETPLRIVIDQATGEPVDHALAPRLSPTHLQLHTHGGHAITQRVCHALKAAGLDVLNTPPLDPRQRYPEAPDMFEACLLDTLARCPSPLGIDLLLEQRDLWHNNPGFDPRSDIAQRRASALAPLLDPPLVAAVGFANAGKSTLTNALARRAVAVVADEPGTTRDHLGVTINAAGLVIRWIDTPGILPPTATPSDIDTAALALASEATANAALIVHCGDPHVGFVPDNLLARHFPCDAAAVLRCLTKADLADRAPADSDISTAAGGATPDHASIDRFAAALRDAIVPHAAVNADEPWLFHPSLVDAPQPR